MFTYLSIVMFVMAIPVGVTLMPKIHQPLENSAFYRHLAPLPWRIITAATCIACLFLYVGSRIGAY